jgi:hypothetical protein
MFMCKSLWIISFLFAAIVAPTGLRADDITYTVSQRVGAGTVTGSIETDGTIGVLGTSNIVNWDLVVTDGSVTYDVLGPLSGNNTKENIGGPATSATATEIFFDFNAVDNGSFVSFFNPLTNESGWGLEDGYPGFPISPASGEFISAPPSFIDASADTGVQVIATAVPEPSTYALMMIGIGCVMVMRKRKVEGHQQAS